jgi:hypothetical protein
MSATFRAILRAALWIVVTLVGSYAILWLFERLLVSGILGPLYPGIFIAAGSMWLYVVPAVIAFAGGTAAAYACDRIFTRRREGSRPLGRRPQEG